MSLKLLAIDLGKQSFQLHGIDADGIVISRKVRRTRLAEVVNELAPTTIAMEACASAHHWGRLFAATGRQVRLINPRFVKAFVRGSKNDAVDAEAIHEAATRPTMRFVPVKSTDQRDLQSLHRARERLVCQRTALINHTRGLLAEYGIVLPQGSWRFTARAPTAIAEAELSELAREIFADLFDQLCDVDRRIDKLDTRIVAICRSHAGCRQLARLPGVGPIIATCFGRSRRRWPPLPFRSRTCSVDWTGAQTVHDRRQAEARRYRTARQPLPQTPDDPRRSSRCQPPGEAQ